MEHRTDFFEAKKLENCGTTADEIYPVYGVFLGLDWNRNPR